MQHSLVRNSLVLSFASVLSALTAIVAAVLIAGTYGLSAQADAYYIAIILSSLANMIFQTSVAAVLVPAVSQATKEAGDRLVQSLLTIGLTGGALLYAAFALAAAPLMHLLAPGFDEATVEITVRLFRYTAVGVCLSFPSEILRSYLNTKGVFGWPAAAEALRTGAIAVGILLLASTWGIDAAALGFCAGHVIQFLFLLSLAAVKGLPLRWAFDRGSSHLKTFLRQFRILAAGGAANLAPLLLQRILASLLPSGGVAVFSIAQQIVFILFAVALKGASTATHPIVSKQAAEGDIESMNATLVKGIKLSALLGGAVFIFIATLNRDAVGLLVGFRSFTQEDGELLSSVLLILTVMLPVNGLAQVVRLSHYAVNRGHVPAWHMLGMGLFHALTQVALFQPFGVMGIAWAQVSFVWLTMATSFALIPAANRSVIHHSLWPVTKVVGISFVIGLSLYSAHDFLYLLADDALVPMRVLWVGVLSLLSGVAVLAAFGTLLRRDFADVFSVPDLRMLAKGAMNRISRRSEH